MRMKPPLPGLRVGAYGRSRDRIAVGIHDPAGDRGERLESDRQRAVLVVSWLDVEHLAELPPLVLEEDHPVLVGRQGQHVELSLFLGSAIVLATYRPSGCLDAGHWPASRINDPDSSLRAGKELEVEIHDFRSIGRIDLLHGGGEGSTGEAD